MKDISIIIVSYNTRELLSDCLNSIKQSKGNLDIETFVVDNNSKDDTVSYLKDNFQWVYLIENKENLGFSKANNIALKKARGKYLLILNPDTKLLPDTLKKIIELANHTDEKTGIITCRVVLPDGSLDNDCRRSFPTPWRSLTHFTRLSKIFPKTKLFDSYYLRYLSEDKEHEVDSCVGAFMFIKSEVLKKVGLFDEDYFFYGEDLDLCFRTKQAGYKIIYTPITKIIHYKGAASGIKKHSENITKATIESKTKALKESTRAMRLFYSKHLKKDYPFFINSIVFTTINLVETLRLLRIRK